jgi:probable F420-dependent oxidoreductase
MGSPRRPYNWDAFDKWGGGDSGRDGTVSEIKFGVRLPVAGPLATPAGIKRSVREAEAMGFDTAWVHDYLIWTKELDRLHISCGSIDAVEAAGDDYPPMFYESLANLAFCAAVTDRIRLGVAVLCLPYRDPVVTAKQIATIDALSNGRVDLGIGQGAPKSTYNVDFEVLGISRRDKVKRTREYFEAMRTIWSEDCASFQGQFVNFDGATIYPKPVQKPHPPVWIGGSAELSLEMVADYADGWLSFFITAEQFRRANADLQTRLEARGRAAESLTIASELYCVLAETTAEAERIARPTMQVFDQAMAGTTGRFADNPAATSTGSEVWASSLIGSPTALRDQITHFVDAGVSYFELKFLYYTVDHLLAQWEMFVDEVAPAFK